jgi:hypothetical protein
MARPPARKAGEPLKPFVVADFNIMYDFDNKRCEAGDQIMLTQAQAKYYQKLGCITFDMGAVFDDNNNATDNDTAEAGPEHEAVDAGVADTGDSPEPTPEPKRAGTRR